MGVIMVFSLLIGRSASATGPVIENIITAEHMNQYIILSCPEPDCLSWLKNVTGEGAESEENTDYLETEEHNEDEETTEEDEESESSEVAEAYMLQEDEAVAEIFEAGQLRINEIMAAPESGQDEWVEIYNPGSEAIQLDDWKLLEGSGQKTQLAGTIEPGEYRVFDKSSLNNGGDLVELQAPDGTMIDQVKYGDWSGATWPTADKGNSIILIDGQYQETIKVTEGALNIAEGSESIVAEGSEPIVAEAYMLRNEEIVEVNVVEANTIRNEEVPEYQYSEDIQISELLPNPVGSDSAEWLELFNDSDQPVDLLGWELDDDEGGSKPFLIADKTVILPQSYMVFSRKKTGLSLGNSADKVVLRDPAGKVIDEVKYSSSREGQSYALVSGEWQSNGNLTPGAMNSLVDLQIASVPKKSSAKYYRPVTADEARDLPKNTLVKVTASVIAEPGIFGKSVMYIDGLQLYFSKAIWPELSVGSLVEVKGKISISRGEQRILVSAESDIKVLESESLIEAQEITSKMVGGSALGRLVNIEGTLLEKKSSRLILSDNEGEFLVYLKQGAGISSSLFEPGDKVNLSGIVTRYDEEYRIQPRSEDDVEIMMVDPVETLGAVQVAGVATAKTASSSWVSTTLLIILSIFGCLNAYFIFRRRDKLICWLAEQKIKAVNLFRPAKITSLE